MGAHYINVAPRFTCGSPASVEYGTATRVYAEELDAFERDAEARKAPRETALHLIVFEMVEVARGWWVYDWLTEQMHWWPFKADCPKCKAKKCTLKRGFIEDHQCPFRFSGYLGRLANEDERIVNMRRFFGAPKKKN